MIFGSHIVVFGTDADGERAFLRDQLGFDHVDAGGGWLLFGLPPAEVGVHPSWGMITKVRLPGGGEVGLYRPTHPTMVERR
jgi:hypothetical protein